MPLPNVAFICTHNSCRSQMAEALGKRLAPDVFTSWSAGTAIKDQINPDAVRLMKARYGIDMEADQYPKRLEDLPPVDVVITMGCGVQCPSLPCKIREDWGLDDPTGQDDAVFHKTMDAIEERIILLREKLIEATPAAGPSPHPC